MKSNKLSKLGTTLKANKKKISRAPTTTPGRAT